MLRKSVAVCCVVAGVGCAPANDQLCDAVGELVEAVRLEPAIRASWRGSVEEFAGAARPDGVSDGDAYRSLLEERVAAREEVHVDATLAAICAAARGEATPDQIRSVAQYFREEAETADAETFMMVTEGLAEWQAEASLVYRDMLRDVLDEVDAEARRRGILE